MSKPFRINLISVILISLSAFYFFSCEEAKEPKQQNYPIIQTNAVTDIDSSGVTFNGELLKIGTDEVLDYGFVWSTDSKPTTQDFIISLGKNIKSLFSTNINFDLVAHQNYSVRVYVITSKNIVYGNEETFTSLGSSTPIIESFSPMNGLDGDTVTIQGENFGSTLNSNIVNIGTVTATVLSTNNTTIKILIPPIPQSGSYKIQVTSNSKSGISLEEFVIEKPKISSFTPDRGLDGTTITINGEYFSYNRIFNRVYLNQMLCQVIESNRNQLKIVTPVTQFVGDAKIVVNINGKISVSQNDFFVEGPYITNINPLHGSYNDIVNISGEGFSSVPSENIVMFGSLKATILAASANELSVAVPDLPGDPVTVSIR
ncbi:MAG: IPT/TIG domain-containing protein, partial [Cyclobacteriaceae bacterium]|nr:IPT/TIG domain-containing protein [Cyclobacteriaceae bacterium]